MAAIAILGGTFDPVHNAHLAMARAALDALEPSRVLWIPTGNPPYRRPPAASATHRLAMLRLAIAGEPRYAIDERELAPGASGYMVDTLGALRTEVGDATPLALLMGADQYAAIETWHRWREIGTLAQIAVIERPGERAPKGVRVIPMAPMALSASDIRARIAAGAEVSALLPRAVLDYIRENHLYH